MDGRRGQRDADGLGAQAGPAASQELEDLRIRNAALQAEITEANRQRDLNADRQRQRDALEASQFQRLQEQDAQRLHNIAGEQARIADLQRQIDEARTGFGGLAAGLTEIPSYADEHGYQTVTNAARCKDPTRLPAELAHVLENRLSVRDRMEYSILHNTVAFLKDLQFQVLDYKQEGFIGTDASSPELQVLELALGHIKLIEHLHCARLNQLQFRDSDLRTAQAIADGLEPSNAFIGHTAAARETAQEASRKTLQNAIIKLSGAREDAPPDDPSAQYPKRWQRGTQPRQGPGAQSHEQKVQALQQQLAKLQAGGAPRGRRPRGGAPRGAQPQAGPGGASQGPPA
jgi:hypothetical protein